MNLMVIGGGGREHAVVKKLRENPEVGTVYVLPGNAGIARDAVCVDISATDLPAICEFARTHDVGYAVVTPDDPLALGCVDALEKLGIPCFGPEARAAVIESSKIFSKRLMQKYGIPTAECRIFYELERALDYLDHAPIPVVIKADGLALGKGVVIAQSRDEAKDAAVSMMRDLRFGQSGARIVVEEFLEGPEVSVLTFTDGKTVVPMVSSMDHKRAFDGDAGPNTGGMGAVAPNPYYTKELARTCMERIFLPTIRAMNAEKRTFRGCLYFGLMLTKDGPKVIEYNCRFGDPETQVVLPLLKSDLLTVMRAVTDGKLAETEVVFSDEYACCVVMASKGYPLAYEKGFPLTIPEAVSDRVFIAGAAERDGTLVTNGGRVLGCTAVAPTLSGAVEDAYRTVAAIRFDNAFYRHDIGACAMAAPQEG